MKTDARYDYKILTGTVPSDLEKQLNAVAAEGWELLSTACSSGGSIVFGSGVMSPLIVLVLRRLPIESAPHGGPAIP